MGGGGGFEVDRAWQEFYVTTGAIMSLGTGLSPCSSAPGRQPAWYENGMQGDLSDRERAFAVPHEVSPQLHSIGDVWSTA